MIESIGAWRCIGCGKLEAPQNCIGVCQDQRVELVYAADYAALADELARMRAERDALADALGSRSAAVLATVRSVVQAPSSVASHVRPATRSATGSSLPGVPVAPEKADAVREDKARLRRHATFVVR